MGRFTRHCFSRKSSGCRGPRQSNWVFHGSNLPNLPSHVLTLEEVLNLRNRQNPALGTCLPNSLP